MRFCGLLGRVLRGVTLALVFGLWNSVSVRFAGWAKTGIWESLFNALADNPDFEYLIIDSTIVRAHQHAVDRRYEKTSTASMAMLFLTGAMIWLR